MLSDSRIVQMRPHSVPPQRLTTQRLVEAPIYVTGFLLRLVARIRSIALLSRLSATTHLQEDHLGRSLHLAENFSQVSQR